MTDLESNMSNNLPDCCFPSEEASLAEQMYCTYNRGGDPITAGLNYQGKPCPLWTELPQNIRDKWEAVSETVVALPDSVMSIMPVE